MDNAIGIFKNRVENRQGAENPHFRPMQEIILEAIGNYRNRSNCPVSYKRSPDYRNIEYSSKELKNTADKIVLPKTPKDLVDQLKGKLHGEAGYAYIESWNDNQQFEDLFPTGSGLDARFIQNHPELFDLNGRPVNFNTYFGETKKEGKSVMNEVYEVVLEARKKAGKPISSSHILEHFLQRNSGEIGESLYDTAITLKFMARNDRETGLYSARKNPEVNTLWFVNNILDEFAGPSYHDTLDGEAQINLIGKPYHSFNLVSLLQFVPVELIQSATGFEYLNYGEGHGSSKAIADIQTLSDLRSVEGRLLEYS
ncbi:MAG: hypothetical protein Q8P72_06375 [Candidatus Roizmanbacteria bacterium]|nr:hypothetical protein [Candidatus Roizmanbacteria bacterium]